MPSWAGWALAAVVLLVVAVALWLRLRGRGASALKAGAELLAKWHAAQARRSKQRVDKLKEDFEGNADKIDKLEARLEVQKRKLAEDLDTQGLSPEEIAAEFRNLDL